MADIASLAMLAAGAVHDGPEPLALGMASAAWIVAAAMAVLVGVALYLKVPKTITVGLDKSIAAIKHQLEEAKALRAEAEALHKQYANKIADAEREAAEMLDHARDEAEAIVAKAVVDTTALIARREKMASDKISAAELAAIQELRATAATVATTAASALIKARHGAGADKALVDSAIAEIN